MRLFFGFFHVLEKMSDLGHCHTLEFSPSHVRVQETQPRDSVRISWCGLSLHVSTGSAQHLVFRVSIQVFRVSIQILRKTSMRTCENTDFFCVGSVTTAARLALCRARVPAVRQPT